MAKSRQPLFVSQPLPRYPLLQFKSNKKDNSDWTMNFLQPNNFGSGVTQLGRSLHQILASLLSLLISCSDIFLLLGHVLKILYEIVESVLTFLLSVCTILWLFIICSVVIIRRVWELLFFTPGLVYIVFDLLSCILNVIFKIFLFVVFYIVTAVVLNTLYSSSREEKLHHHINARK
ncbi:hypothetical protein GDO81_003272 [Engystomops pustulosus]|uniref:Uncharacterized protein n=1 Tax=Engystomops pustulosus TaxID=76066 RepID=A0AAV7A3E4_ENGPU|nr:hypothetical protein GDO81_003272 [Engystomops pustulosus]